MTATELTELKRLTRRGVRIGDVSYSVSLVLRARWPNKDPNRWFYGQIVYADSVIWINPKQSLARAKDTMMHEILHGVFHAWDVSHVAANKKVAKRSKYRYTSEEQLVTSLATTLVGGLAADNRSLFKWMFKR